MSHMLGPGTFSYLFSRPGKLQIFEFILLSGSTVSIDQITTSLRIHKGYIMKYINDMVSSKLITYAEIETKKYVSINIDDPVVLKFVNFLDSILEHCQACDNLLVEDNMSMCKECGFVNSGVPR